jgi:hypothetical protein
MRHIHLRDRFVHKQHLHHNLHFGSSVGCGTGKKRVGMGVHHKPMHHVKSEKHDVKHIKPLRFRM